MEVSYTLNRDDVWAFYRFHLYRKKRLLRGVDLLGSAVILLGWLLLSWTIVRRVIILVHLFGGTPYLWNILWLGERQRVLYWLLLTAYAVYLVWGNRWLALHRAVSDKTLAEPKTLRLTADGVHVTSPTQQSTLAWATIREVAGDSQRLYLYTSPLNALVIPRQAFPTPEQASAFEAAARSYQANPYAASGPADPAVWPPPPSHLTPMSEATVSQAERDDMSAILTVSYVTRRSDLWRNALLLAGRRPASLLNLALPCLFPALILVFVSHVPPIPVLEGGVLIWLLLVGRWLHAMVVSRLPDPRAERSCRSLLRPDAFVDITPNGRTVLPWREVGEVFTFLGDLHLFRRDGIGGLFIPRTAFTSPQEARAFLDAMRTLHDIAHKEGQPTA